MVNPNVVIGAWSGLDNAALAERSRMNSGKFYLDHAKFRIARNGACITLGKVTFRFLAGLMSHKEPIKSEKIIEHVYGDNASGGALDPMALFWTLLNRRNPKRFSALGISISSRHGFGISFVEDGPELWHLDH